jgi:hypothetical protein
MGFFMSITGYGYGFIEDHYMMSESMQNILLLDRRSGKDRRSRGVPDIKSLFIYARRKNIRRKDDKFKTVYFDQYSPALFTPVVLILLLSVTDAFLTLFLVDCGAREINPVMAYFLKFGPFTFMGVKYFFTCYSVIVLVIFNNVYFRKLRIRTRSLFSCAVAMFVIVIAWELFLMSRILF